MDVITIQSEAMQTLLQSNANLAQKLGALLERLEDTLSTLSAPKPSPNTLEWADTDQTCKMLNVSPRTLQKYRDEGTIPFSNIGGKKYFRIADIQCILEQNYNSI